MQLALPAHLRDLLNMKTQKSIPTKTNCRLLLLVPVICSMALAACSDFADTPGGHQTVNLQSALAAEPQARDNVTIGPTTYNPETRNFDRPWPFGPEGGAQ
jgi:hypothetical protein